MPLPQTTKIAPGAVHGWVFYYYYTAAVRSSCAASLSPGWGYAARLLQTLQRCSAARSSSTSSRVASLIVLAPKAASESLGTAGDLPNVERHHRAQVDQRHARGFEARRPEGAKVERRWPWSRANGAWSRQTCCTVGGSHPAVRGRPVSLRLWLDASRLARLARAIGGCSPSGRASTFTSTNGKMSCRRATSQAAADEQPQHRLAPSRPTTCGRWTYCGVGWRGGVIGRLRRRRRRRPGNVPTGGCARARALAWTWG